MRTVTKKVKVKIVQEVEQPIEIYDAGDLLDISECKPEETTSAVYATLRDATRALVLSVTPSASGNEFCPIYRVLINSADKRHPKDNLTGLRISASTIAGAKYLEHWDVSRLTEVKK